MKEWPLTRAELARRYGVSPSAVTRALARAEETHRNDPSLPAPPQPVNPGEPLLRYLPSEFDPWWANRPARGRPRTVDER
jgi:transposase-like protein